jgi:hypothetical protein
MSDLNLPTVLSNIVQEVAGPENPVTRFIEGHDEKSYQAARTERQKTAWATIQALAAKGLVHYEITAHDVLASKSESRGFDGKENPIS